MTPPEITVYDFHHLRQNGTPYHLIDVREPWEFDIARLPEAELIPLGTLLTTYEDLQTDRFTVLMCHHGIRSLQACLYLRDKGLQQVSSLKGGIHLWSLSIDSKTPVY